MTRLFHRWPGLIGLALLALLALSGAALSIFPAAERMSSPQADPVASVAQIASRIQSAIPGVEQIRRSPSGRITALWFDNGTPGSAVIDPATGEAVGAADPNQVERWLTNLHRSLFLDDTGRLASAAGAAAMLLLSVSGILLVARRTGGLRRWFAPLRGPLAGRIHVELARAAVLGLLLSSATALWMTASTFSLLPDGPAAMEQSAASGTKGAVLSAMPLLAATPIDELRELTFPYPDDATDVFTLKTDSGSGAIDQGTGQTLGWVDLSAWERATETVYMLHTGRGASLLGLLLGAMALAVPVMGGTGLVIWAAARRGRPSIRGNASPSVAHVVVLVGSEGGSTWGFAATLHAALARVGKRVHVAPMSAFAPDRTRGAQHYIVLAATYGDGDAPASAKGFLDRLGALRAAPTAAVAVLGFGDRSFPRFCAYAEEVNAAARAKGWDTILPFDTIDRQSPQEFARWGRALGQALGIELELNHQPVAPRTTALTLLSRRNYGQEVQAPMAILRFVLPRRSLLERLTGRGFARFEAGDLVGVLPQGSTVPRFYSLASGRRDGFLEIVVRKHVGGACSDMLTGLEPGQSVEAFLRRNPTFHPPRGLRPLILIGAGTGIGPLAGFVRANDRLRPIHLFFGMRHRDSDFLYGEELARWSSERRLASLVTACSRGAHPRYVQHAIARESASIAAAIGAGAQIMVCGGREMAAGVAETLAAILEPMGLSPARLKAEGRYVEDVY
ncbi:MAG: PepSY domain-containing protein [Rhizobiaceae bacterium]|jgi:sulfite reductase (NADPH) flavoprotein alpha-component|nr:PepSY domain-containing protein [Rhizobiaceae bacterium]